MASTCSHPESQITLDGYVNPCYNMAIHTCVQEDHVRMARCPSSNWNGLSLLQMVLVYAKNKEEYLYLTYILTYVKG
jgi:hypothetical protein